MSRTDFHVEFYSEFPATEAELELETEERLRQLGEEESDMIGASVAIEELTGEETPHMFQVRIVAYIRPDNIVVVEKNASLEIALREALTILERQVRAKRELLRKPWQGPAKVTKETALFELTPEEIYDTFASQSDPQALLKMGRTGLASRLMVDDQLEQEAAYHAADQILLVAEQIIAAEEG